MKKAIILAGALALASGQVPTAGARGASQAVSAVPAGADVNTPGARGYLARGVLMADNANWHGAVDQLTQALESGCLDARDTETARFQLARALAHLPGERGLEAFRRFVADYPSSALCERARMGIADCLYDRCRWGEALAAYLEVRDEALTSTQRASLIYRLAYCRLMRGEERAALTAFESLTSDPVYGAGARFYVATIAYDEGDLKRARQLLTPLEGSKEAPADMAPYYLAQIDYAEGDFAKAASRAKQLLRCADLAPEFKAETERIAGESLYRTGDRDAALPYLERYVAETESPKPSALYLLGLDAYQQGDNDRAVELLTSVVNENNSLGQNAYLLVGQAYLAQGNYDAATMALERACRLDFDEAAREQAYYNYGVSRLRGGRVPFGSTVTLFEDFITRYPESSLVPQVRDYLVSGYVADGNYASALATLDRATRRTDKVEAARQQVLYQWGVRQLQSGQDREAAAHLAEAASMGRHDAALAAEASLWQGEALYRTGDYTGAVQALNTYLKSGYAQGQNRAMAYYDLGYARFALKQYGTAATDFNNYLKYAAAGSQADQRADALNRLGDCRYYSHDFDSAAKTYARAIEASPSTGDYPAFQQAMMKGLERDHEEKISLLDAMMERYSRSPLKARAMLETGHALEALGRHDEAIARYTEAAETYPGTEHGRQGLLMAAITYNSLGDTPTAKAVYRRVIERYPSSEEARTAAEDLKHLSAADGTLARYAEFIADIPDAPALDDAEASALMLSSATDAATAGRHADAIARADELLERYPDAVEAVEALRVKAEAEQALGMAPKAWETYTMMASKASSAEDVTAARLGLMRTGRDLGKNDEVLAAAEALLASGGTGTDERAEATFAKALSLSNMGRADEAAELWKGLAADPESLWGAKSAWYLGSQYLAAGRLGDAERVATTVIDSATPHEYWLAKAFILLSDVRRRQNNNFEADEYLRALRENYPGTETDIFNDIDSRLAASPNKSDRR